MIPYCDWTKAHPCCSGTVCTCNQSPARTGKRVGCSVVEAFGDKPKPQELEQVLRLEYRSKLLNPKVQSSGCCPKAKPIVTVAIVHPSSSSWHIPFGV